MAILYDMATVAAATLLAGNEFAVAAFIHPQLKRLPAEAHARMAGLLARVLGRAMPFWYVLCLLLIAGAACMHRPLLHGPGLLLSCAALLWAAIIAFTIAILVPINNRIAGMAPERPHPTWIEDRERWDRLHWVRVGALFVAVALLLTGVLWTKGRAGC